MLIVKCKCRKFWTKSWLKAADVQLTKDTSFANGLYKLYKVTRSTISILSECPFQRKRYTHVSNMEVAISIKSTAES